MVSSARGEWKVLVSPFSSPRRCARPGSLNQHGVAVAVEAIALAHRFRVRIENRFTPREGTDQQEQRGAWEVEVREQRIDNAEPVSGHDERVRQSYSRANGAVRRRR